MKFLKILVFPVLLLAGCSQNQEEILNIISVTGEHWVPDKREGIFDVSFKKLNGGIYLLQGETDILEAKNEVLEKLTAAGYQVQDSIKLLPNDVPFQWGLASLSVVSLRSEPDHDQELSNQALMGTPVKILKSKDGWLYIQTPDKYLAWGEEGSITPMDEKMLASWRNSKRVIVTSTQDYILDSIGNRRISDVVAGCILQKNSENNKVISVTMPDGRKGLLPRESVLDFDDWSENAVIDSALLTETAFAMIGFPYLWGANSTKALDCSGFTKTIYYLNGVILARDASLQALHGEKIPTEGGYKNYQAGDLLFFGRPGHITHVAMYIGNSEYIHSAGHVQINSLEKTHEKYSDYRATSLQSSSRIIGSVGDDGIISVKDHPWY